LALFAKLPQRMMSRRQPQIGWRVAGTTYRKNGFKFIRTGQSL
jgi:hypothetical protein